MKNVFSIKERSSECWTEFDILAEILEIVLRESNYPLYGSLIIGTRKHRAFKKVLEIHIGTDDGSGSQRAFEQNMCIYADLCIDVMKSLHRAAISRTEPTGEGLQHITRGNPRSLYLRIGETPFYIVYFATYASESTGREIERVYLAIAEILRRLFLEDEHLCEVAGEIINEILPQEEVVVYPDNRDTMTVIEEEFSGRP